MDSEKETHPFMKRRAQSAEPTKAEQAKRRKLLSEGQEWLQQHREEIVRLALTEVTDKHGEIQTVNDIPKYHGPSIVHRILEEKYGDAFTATRGELVGFYKEQHLETNLQRHHKLLAKNKAIENAFQASFQMPRVQVPAQTYDEQPVFDFMPTDFQAPKPQQSDDDFLAELFPEIMQQTRANSAPPQVTYVNPTGCVQESG